MKTTTTTVIRNVRPLGGAAADVMLDGASISAVVPAGRASPGLPTLVDGQGSLLVPALVEAHTHFDKTLWATPWWPNSAGPTRNHRITNEHAVLKGFEVPMAERAIPLIEQCIARGSLYFRSHVDAQTVWGLQHVKDMLALREHFKDVIELQLVTFPQGGMLVAPGTPELMERSLELGVDVVGGIDPAGIDNDPIRHLETVFDLATRHARGIDIHLHDLGELGRWEIERIADMTAAHGMQGRVMLSHAYALGAFAPADLHRPADRLRELRISVITCAPAHVTVPPVAMLRARGVNVCSGSDGIRDAWSPMGNGDMLERARLVAHRFGWSKDEDLAMAFDLVTGGGARALGLEGYGVQAGCQANLVLLDAENIPAAVVDCGMRRTVISRGRVVARDGVYAGP